MLVDENRDKAEGEAMNLKHSLPFSYATRIWAGELNEAGHRLSRREVWAPSARLLQQTLRGGSGSAQDGRVT